MRRKISAGKKSSALAGNSCDNLRADIKCVEHLEIQ